MCAQYDSTILEWNDYSEEMYVLSKRQLPSGKASSTTYRLQSKIFQKLWCQNMELAHSTIENRGVIWCIQKHDQNLVWNNLQM